MVLLLYDAFIVSENVTREGITLGRAFYRRSFFQTVWNSFHL